MCCDYCEYWRVSTGIMALGSVVWMCRDYLHSQKFRDGWSRDVQECWRLKPMAIASYEVTEVQTFAVSSKKIVLYILIYLKLELKKKKKNQTNNNTKKQHYITVLSTAETSGQSLTCLCGSSTLYISFVGQLVQGLLVLHHNHTSARLFRASLLYVSGCSCEVSRAPGWQTVWECVCCL